MLFKFTLTIYIFFIIIFAIIIFVLYCLEGNCNVHCSRIVPQPLASTQSATVYINIHSAAMVSVEEERVALLFACVNTFIQQKGARICECPQSTRALVQSKDERITILNDS